jgi:hypothetical protein
MLTLRRGTLFFFGMLFTPAVLGQIVINEFVKEERSASGGVVDFDTREFVELYNAGNQTIDLANWSIGYFDLGAGNPGRSDFITAGSIGPGEYFLIGPATLPGVDFTPELFSNEYYPDLQPGILELRNPDFQLVDAIGYDMYRAKAVGFPSAEQTAQIGSGFQGALISPNASAPNSRVSFSRYQDGVDTNRNGLDFGFLPLTPGVSNETLPVVPSHTIVNVDSIGVGTALSNQYYTSFVMPRVIDPTVATSVNPRALPTRSPQGGNAIIAWDETGGGNTVYSRELVNKFELYAYFDTTPLGVAAATLDEEYEIQAYGIGSADPLFDQANPSGLIPSDEVPANTLNGSTGLGWVYQQFEPDPDGLPGSPFSKLFLVDFGDGGNSVPSANEWDIIQEFDLSDDPSGWYRLGIDYNPTTGAVVAKFGNETINFTTDTGRFGNFYVGYREGITGSPSSSGRFPLHNPPIYDLYVAATPVAGDYNGDGSVTSADYMTWKNAFGTNVTPGSGADGNGNGVVDAADYTFWRDRFTGSGAAAAAVPEPAAILLAACGLALLPSRRRR